MRARNGLTALLLAAALAASAAPSPGAEPEAFELDAFRWRAEATPQAEIRATNEWGDLRVRTAVRGGLVVSAMIQKIGSSRDELEVRIDERPDRVVVEVVALVPEPRGRVDLTLMVPPGKRLEGVTRDGLAEIKYRGEVVARSRGGDVTVQAAERASARSETGTVTVKLAGGS